jgi:hypothetical protein
MSQVLKFCDSKIEGGDYAEVQVKERGDMYQVVFSVGVQSFDIGPEYPTLKEGEWMMNMFSHALGKFAGIVTGVTLVDKI